jgi:hypothetical protein
MARPARAGLKRGFCLIEEVRGNRPATAVAQTARSRFMAALLSGGSDVVLWHDSCIASKRHPGVRESYALFADSFFSLRYDE